MAEIIAINANTWRIEDDGVRFFLLEGNERALLIDSGMRTANAGELARSVTNKPLSLLNTHADIDHIAGNAAFDTCYMSPAEEENYRANGGKNKILPVREGDVLDLGERPLEIIDNPGHTPGSIAILDIKNRALIAGDSVQDGKIFMFGEKRNLPLYIDGLKNVNGHRSRFDSVYPSHGTFPVKPELIDSLITGAGCILSGNAEGKTVDVFGTRVMLYSFPYAGFLCEVPEEK